jgi:hypothetical protein
MRAPGAPSYGILTFFGLYERWLMLQECITGQLNHTGVQAALMRHKNVRLAIDSVAG